MERITRRKLLDQLHGTALWVHHISIKKILEVDDTLPERFQEVLKSYPHLQGTETLIWFIRKAGMPSKQGGQTPLNLGVYDPKSKRIVWLASGMTIREMYKILTAFCNAYGTVFDTFHSLQE